MADLNLASSTQSVSVVECKIIGSNGRIKDLTNPLIYDSIQIYESIYSPVITGTIQLTEGVNLATELSLHGNEYLFLSFCRPGENDKESRYTRTFRIYKCGMKRPNSQIQSYVLYFCSEELVFSKQQTISRSFKGRSTSDYIYNILTQDLKTNKKRVNTRYFEKAEGNHNYVITKYNPLDAIKYLEFCSYNANESPFLFFENRDGYNFVSLETLFKAPALDPPLNYNTAKILFDQSESAFKNANDIKSFEFNQLFDVLDSAKESAYCGRLYTLDLIRQKFTKHDYSLINSLARNTMMDGFFPVNNFKNRNDRALFEEFNGQPMFWLTNLNQNETEYFISKAVREQNTDIEKFLLQRKVQLGMLNRANVECRVPGNPNYSVGYMVEFNLPAFMTQVGSVNERILDPYYKGKYLITRVRHSITPDSLETVLELNKNSVAISFDGASNDNQAVKTARDF
jgi:hypothetical protein